MDSSKDLGSEIARHNRQVMSTGRGTEDWKSMLMALPEVFLFLNIYINVLSIKVLLYYLY